MIWLNRRPILDYWAEHEETLGALVTHVLVHEIGHHSASPTPTWMRSRPPPTSAGPAPPRRWLAWRQALEPAGAVVVAVDGVFVGVRDRSPVDQLALFGRVPSTPEQGFDPLKREIDLLTQRGPVER